MILVRHGYSTSNASGTYTGQLDAPLNEIGFAQAAQLADHLCKTYQIDAVYTSDLSRAVETVRPTAERLGLEIHREQALRELDTGKWTGIPYAAVRERYAADFAAYGQSIDAPCTGGESIRKACERLLAFFEKAEREWDGKTVLVCSHALCCRLLAALADTASVEGIRQNSAPPNASFSVYEYENGAVRTVLRHYTNHLDNATKTVLPGLV
jgi:probable phosphoglycerate mutase